MWRDLTRDTYIQLLTLQKKFKNFNPLIIRNQANENVSNLDFIKNVIQLIKQEEV